VNHRHLEVLGGDSGLAIQPHSTSLMWASFLQPASRDSTQAAHLSPFGVDPPRTCLLVSQASQSGNPTTRLQRGSLC